MSILRHRQPAARSAMHSDHSPFTIHDSLPGEPLVSVVIPAYNSEKYIAEAIRSVLEQTYRNIEVIVVDDGSTDETFDAATGQIAGDARFHIVRLPRNMGAADARNEGVRLAKGEFVAFLDADDIWFSQKIATQVGVMLGTPECGLSHTDSSIIDAKGKIVKLRSNPNRQTGNGRVFEQFFMSDVSVALTSTVMVRRDCFQTTGLFDGRFNVSQDHALFLRFAWHYPVLFINEPLTGYRRLPGTLSRTSVLKNIRDHEEIIREFVEMHKEYFDSHPELLKRKVDGMNWEFGMLLFHHREYTSSHSYLGKVVGRVPKALPYWLVTLAPESWLRRLRAEKRTVADKTVDGKDLK